jgi:hypothetical protein
MVLAIGKGMTRKDYQLIASALKESREDCITELARLGVQVTAIKIAKALKRDNSRFNEDRFLDACGIPESEINQ